MDPAAAANEALAEECLRASAFVYAESRKRLREQQALEGEPLREVKRAAMSMNRAVAEYIKRARAREDRLLVELHLLRQAAERDATDRDANRARIYEVLRRNFESGHADDEAPPGKPGEAWPPTAHHKVVQKRVGSCEAREDGEGEQAREGLWMLRAEYSRGWESLRRQQVDQDEQESQVGHAHGRREQLQRKWQETCQEGPFM